MNEPFTPGNDASPPGRDADDARFLDAALGKLTPVLPSEILTARILAIPKSHPRARVIDLVSRRSAVVALAAAALLGLLAGGLYDLDAQTDTTDSELAALDLPYGFDLTTTDLEGLDP